METCGFRGQLGIRYRRAKAYNAVSLLLPLHGFWRLNSKPPEFPAKTYHRPISGSCLFVFVVFFPSKEPIYWHTNVSTREKPSKIGAREGMNERQKSEKISDNWVKSTGKEARLGAESKKHYTIV